MRLLAAVALLAAPSAASADAEAKEAFRVGLQAFRANEFATAARSFEEAHARDPRPETAFSIAQANRLQYVRDRMPWRIARAVQLYREYLDALPKGPRAKDASDRVLELEAILKELRQRGELTPYAPPLRTEIVVGADVETASVTIDGAPTQLWAPVEVAPGVREIVIEAPGFEVARRRVQITEGRFLPVDVALVAKPGKLEVRGSTGATLYIDGRAIGELPEQARIAAGSHFVSVTARGRRTWNREIAIGRDQALTLEPRLEPTSQRRAAAWVFMGAGAIAVTAATAGLTAYAAQRDADRLDAKRRALEATPADLAAYNARIEDVEFRSKLGVGLGLGALAVGVVGAGLYWFDRPSPGARVTPVISTQTAGVAVRF